MVVTVTLGDGGRVTLDEPDDVARFHVAVAGGGDRSGLARALGAAGTLDGDDVLVRVAWVRAEAAGRVGPGWEEGLAGMLAYAERKGWLAEDGQAVRAHVEWGPAQ